MTIQNIRLSSEHRALFQAFVVDAGTIVPDKSRIITIFTQITNSMYNT